MIWCVEDDIGIRDIEVYALQSAGFEAKGFEDGAACWEALKSDKPDLLILDVMLPGIDGVELLKRLRRSESLCSIPVIMATAKGTEYDKIQSLDLGADDYIVKPFGIMEMVSRVKAVLRRCQPKPQATILRMGELTLDTARRTVTVGEDKIALTYKEFELLYVFMAHQGMVFSREQLYQTVWGMDFVGESRTVDMHVRTLRQKLGVYGDCIETVRHIGYRMEERA